jgi:hypothetical protein
MWKSQTSRLVVWNRFKQVRWPSFRSKLTPAATLGSAHKAATGLKRRLAAFVNRLHIASESPIALMTDGAESLLRLRSFLPVPTRFVLDYFHVSMKLRHIDQSTMGDGDKKDAEFLPASSKAPWIG